ncbi:LOW QUALITY PROTEIN: hypothetical protein HID58_042650, partial [Brassica napus]
AGKNMNFFIGLYKLHRSITLPMLIVLRCTCARCERICSLVGDRRIRKDHNVGPSKRSKGGHHRRARSGRACRTFFFSLRMRHCPYGGDLPELAESLMKKPRMPCKPDFSLRFLRLSGSTNRVEECMGHDPRILRGRILARLRTRGMSRPKLRILMLDSTGLACSSRARKGCNGLSGGSLCRFPCCLLTSSQDCTLTFGRGDVQHISWTCCLRRAVVSMPNKEGGNIWLNSAIDSWPLSTITAICPSEVSHHQCWDDLASCFHGTQRILGMLSQNLEVRGCDRRLYRLSSRNPEAGWTLVKEPIACMDLSPGTLRIFVRGPDGCVDLQGDLPVSLFDSKSSSSGRLSLIARLFGAVSSFASSSYPLGSLKDGTRSVRLAWTMLEPGGELFFQMVDRGLDEYFQVLDPFEGDLVGFGTLILYFSGRQYLLSGLVTHDLGGMEIFVEAWRLLPLEDHNFFCPLSAPSWKFRKTSVFLSPSLGNSVSYNFSRGAALETWRDTDPEFPRERPARPNVEFAFFFGSFAGGREAVFPALGRDPFAEQLRWNLMSTKRRSIHPAISLILDSTTT